MQLNSRIQKLEQAQQPTGICECPRKVELEVYDESNMTAREVLQLWEAEVAPCSDCSRPRQHFVIRFPMCRCEENLDLRIDIPRNWHERHDHEYWRQIQIQCDECGEPLHYGRLTKEVQGAA